MPPDAINTSEPSQFDPSQAVLDAIMTPKPESKAKEAPQKAPAAVKTAPPEAETGEEATPEAETEETTVEAVSDDPDEEEAAEDEPEEETEGPEDIDDYLVEVLVDGKKQEIKLRDLKASYSGQVYTQQNIQKAVEARKHVEAQAQSLYDNNKTAIDKLTQLDTILKSFAEPVIDWNTLKATDPQTYILKREEAREAAEHRKSAQDEIQRLAAEQEKISSEARARFVKDQAELLAAKLPELADPKTAKALMGRIFTAAEKYYGYTREEVEAIEEHRPFPVLYDAIKWREYQERKASVTSQDKAGKVAPKKVMTLRPAASKPVETSAKRLDAQILKRAQTTGRPDDVAAFLITRKKAQG
jgi:chromosome segregation ATPase